MVLGSHLTKTVRQTGPDGAILPQVATHPALASVDPVLKSTQKRSGLNSSLSLFKPPASQSLTQLGI